MPENTPSTPGASSAFEIVTPSKSKKTSPKNIIIILLVFVFLAGAIFLGVTLVQQNQNIAEKAVVPQCPGAQACPDPNAPNHLLNCTPAESDNSPADSLCYAQGLLEMCGGAQYCCPAAGGSWTSNLTLCPTPTPTVAASATPSATPAETIAPLVSQAPTATASATATATATSSPTSTPKPIPVTGEAWPTYIGAGVGIIVIIASILLAI